MKIISRSPCFEHVAIMLYELYGNDTAYECTAFVLGYNIINYDDLIRVVSLERHAGFNVIVYQLEQLWLYSPWLNAIQSLSLFDEIWDYNLDNVCFLSNRYRMKTHYKPLRYAKSLLKINPVQNEQQDIDILFYGNMNLRRKHIIDAIKADNPKLKITCLTNVWGEILDGYIARAKIVLNLHYYECCYEEQVRIFYPVINNKCVVSEPSQSSIFGDAIVTRASEGIPALCRDLIESGDYKRIGDRAGMDFKITQLRHDYDLKTS